MQVLDMLLLLNSQVLGDLHSKKKLNCLNRSMSLGDSTLKKKPKDAKIV